MRLTNKAVKERLELGEKFNVVIIDKDTDCSINMGFGFIPSSVLVEELDEQGAVMCDDIIGIKEAINRINNSDKNFFEVKIEEIETFESDETYAIWA